MYPGSGSFAGFSTVVIVSPTCKSDTFFTLAAIYPTSPAVNFSDGTVVPGSKYPSSATTNFLFVAINNISSPALTVPSTTLT